MARQLIYTSAPKGLKPGSRGFTTVAASRDLSPPVVSRLEALSGYRFAFNLSDPKADQNPVAFAHQKVRVGDRPITVLSRIAPAGADYSGRSNVLAHHLIVEPDEQPPAGPAWVLAQPGLLRESWDSEPGYIDEPLQLPRQDRSPAPCEAWRKATGDAGWAGAPIRSLIESPRQPVYLIYPPGFDPLPLFEEAIALLPPAKRWAVTFNTYVNNLAPDVECLWRGVLAGSPAARQIPAGATTIDLTRAAGGPVEDDYAAAAREGRTVEPPSTRPTPKTAASAATRPTGDKTPGLADEDEPDESVASDFDRFVEYELETEPPGPRRKPAASTSAPPPPPGASIRIENRSRRGPLLIAVAIAAVLLIAAGASAYFLLQPAEPGKRVAQADSDSEAASTPDQKAKPPEDTASSANEQYDADSSPTETDSQQEAIKTRRSTESQSESDTELHFDASAKGGAEEQVIDESDTKESNKHEQTDSPGTEGASSEDSVETPPTSKETNDSNQQSNSNAATPSMWEPYDISKILSQRNSTHKVPKNKEIEVRLLTRNGVVLNEPLKFVLSDEGFKLRRADRGILNYEKPGGIEDDAVVGQLAIEKHTSKENVRIRWISDNKASASASHPLYAHAGGSFYELYPPRAYRETVSLGKYNSRRIAVLEDLPVRWTPRSEGEWSKNQKRGKWIYLLKKSKLAVQLHKSDKWKINLSHKPLDDAIENLNRHKNSLETARSDAEDNGWPTRPNTASYGELITQANRKIEKAEKEEEGEGDSEIDKKFWVTKRDTLQRIRNIPAEIRAIRSRIHRLQQKILEQNSEPLRVPLVQDGSHKIVLTVAK